VRRASNFQIVCPNQMSNIKSGLSDDEAREAAGDGCHVPSHHQQVQLIVVKLHVEDELTSDVRFSNTIKTDTVNPRRQRMDLGLTRQVWAEGILLPSYKKIFLQEALCLEATGKVPQHLFHQW
jgi:hypothetical protein